ncbi:streptophobe family protein [Streptomyces sp. NPDC004135]
MGAATAAESARDGARVPWGDVLMSAVAAVSWALIGMAGTAALGLRLLEADAAGSLGPMTAAVVALAAGGSVTPSGDVSAFGLTGAEADTAIEITPLGVSLVGAVLLSWFFLRSLRAAGVVIAPAELLARAGAVVVLFVAMLGGLAWAGHDVITIDGGSLGLDDMPGGGGGIEVPGLGDIGGLLPDRLGELVDAQAAVGFTVDTAPTLLGGLGWSAGILAIALLASRRTPLPPGWEAVHRVVRPAASAVVTVLLVAVAAGLAAAAYAAAGDDHPRRVAGAALLGAPNGVWLGVPLGLFVPWDGRATGELTRFLPDPLDDLLGSGTDRPVTLGRLAELDQRVWLLGVAAALMMLLGGVLTAVRTPVVRVRAVRGGSVGSGASGGSDGSGVLERLGAPGVPGRPGAPGRSGAPRASGAFAFAGRCALRLGAATGLALPLLAWLTDVSVTASLSVLGFDAFGAGLDLHGHLGMALLLGAVWGAGAGGAGALLAWAFWVAGRSATALALAAEGRGRGEGDGPGSGAGSVSRSVSEAAGGFAEAYDGGRTGPGPAGRVGDGAWPGYDEGAGRLGPEGRTEAGPGAGPGAVGAGGPGAGGGAAGPWAGVTPQGYREGAGPSGPEGGQAGAGWTGSRGSTSPPPYDAGRPGGPGTAGREAAAHGEESGPYAPGVPYRPPNPATNPYLRVPDELREPEDARPGDHSAPRGDSSATPQGPSATPHDPSAIPQHPSGTPPDPSGTPGAHSAASATPEGRSAASEGRSAAPEEDSLAPDEDPDEGDIYGAPTVVRPVGPPPRGPRQSRGPGHGNGPPSRPDEWPPPPPPPPPPPRTPRGGR